MLSSVLLIEPGSHHANAYALRSLELFAVIEEAQLSHIFPGINSFKVPESTDLSMLLHKCHNQKKRPRLLNSFAFSFFWWKLRSPRPSSSVRAKDTTNIRHAHFPQCQWWTLGLFCMCRAVWMLCAACNVSVGVHTCSCGGCSMTSSVLLDLLDLSLPLCFKRVFLKKHEAHWYHLAGWPITFRDPACLSHPQS